jgi:hypothetical protein
MTTKTTRCSLELPESTTHLLRRSRPSDTLLVPATKGTRTFVTERAMFPDNFVDFEELGTNVTSGPTPAIVPVVYDLTAQATLKTTVRSFEIEIERLLWPSQDSILAFVEKYPNWLNPTGWGTFFPFINGANAFAACVSDVGRGLRACVYSINYSYAFRTRNTQRFIFPDPYQYPAA